MRESFSSGLMHHCVQVLKEQESQRSGPDCPLKLISWLCSAKKHPAIASLVQQEDREARDEGKAKNPQLMGLKRSPPRNPCPPLSDPPNPVPCTLFSHNPLLPLHTPQLRSLPRHNSPSHGVHGHLRGPSLPQP